MADEPPGSAEGSVPDESVQPTPDFTALTEQAFGLMAKGDFPEACAAFKAALRQRPNDLQALYNVAAVENLMGHTDTAREYLTLAAECVSEPEPEEQKQRPRRRPAKRSPEGPRPADDPAVAKWKERLRCPWLGPDGRCCPPSEMDANAVLQVLNLGTETEVLQSPVLSRASSATALKGPLKGSVAATLRVATPRGVKSPHSVGENLEGLRLGAPAPDPTPPSVSRSWRLPRPPPRALYPHVKRGRAGLLPSLASPSAMPQGLPPLEVRTAGPQGQTLAPQRPPGGGASRTDGDGGTSRRPSRTLTLHSITTPTLTLSKVYRGRAPGTRAPRGVDSRRAVAAEHGALRLRGSNAGQQPVGPA